jgi:hypothetical protein
MTTLNVNTIRQHHQILSPGTTVIINHQHYHPHPHLFQLHIEHKIDNSSESLYRPHHHHPSLPSHHVIYVHNHIHTFTSTLQARCLYPKSLSSKSHSWCCSLIFSVFFLVIVFSYYVSLSSSFLGQLQLILPRT